MTALRLRALPADSVLGFLAAVGTLRLVTEELDDSAATLCWPDGPFSAASLQSDFGSIESLVDALAGLVERTKSAGQLFPEVDGFPPVGDTETSADPTSRLSLEDGRGLAISGRRSTALLRWGQATVSMVPPIDRRTGDAGFLEKSRFLRAGPGTVWVPRTLAPVLELTTPTTLREAFDGWRRTDGFIGAYLDHRADVDKATGQGKRDAPKRGVPGATFLALMSLPLFPVRSPDRFASETVGWVSARSVPKGFQWPVWSDPLGLASIAALVDHPEVADVSGVPGQRGRRLEALRVVALFRSLRISAGNNDAAMAAATVVWQPDS